MILDIDALLAPIEGDSPVGQDLRADYTAGSIYYRLRDARSDARAAERAADSDPTLEADAGQHWRSVLQLAQTALGKSHDLEVAAWMTEAMVRENGLAGLAEGARLMAALVQGFWEALYPLPDEDGMETRVAPVAGLNGTGSDGTLIQPLRKLTLFNAADGVAGARLLVSPGGGDGRAWRRETQGGADRRWRAGLRTAGDTGAGGGYGPFHRARARRGGSTRGLAGDGGGLR